MPQRLPLLWSLGLVLLVKAGCSAPAPVPAAALPAVPNWVDRLPGDKGRLCATGSVGPTFYRQDAKVTAAEAARNQLALTLQVKIQSIMVDLQSARAGDSEDQAYVQSVSSYAADTVLTGAQMVSYWFDEQGVRAEPQSTFALACMSTDQSVADLGAKLQKNFPSAEARNKSVAENAKAAFDGLDQEEASRKRQTSSQSNDARQTSN